MLNHGSTMAFQNKVQGYGSIDKYMAWWVAKGYSQHQGFKYDTTYMPVVCIKHLCLLLAYTTTLHLAGCHDGLPSS